MLNKVLKRKLNSNEGASLMVALLFFIMCATIGSVILAAATASSGRLAKLVKEDQKYYTSTSAASLLTEILSVSDTKKNEVVIRMTYDDNSNPPLTNKLRVGDSYVDFKVQNKLLVPDMIYESLNQTPVNFKEDKMKEIFTTSQTDKKRSDEMKYTAARDASITFDGDNKTLDCDVHFYMNKDLDILVVLEPKNDAPAGESDESNKINLWFYAIKKMDGSITEYTDVSGTRNVRMNTYTVQWREPVIAKGKLNISSGGGS